MFGLFNTKIVILNATTEEDFQTELSEDIISIIHYFSIKMYSSRRSILKNSMELLKHTGSLEGKTSSANPQVDLEASDAFAPIATVGFTYDFNSNWFAVGSVSYAQLSNDTTITVTDAKLGELIRSKADIEINPILAYAGIGYRF